MPKARTKVIIRLDDGRDVLGEWGQHGPRALTFANRTQAQKALARHRASIGPAGGVIGEPLHFGDGAVIRRGRVWYVQMKDSPDGQVSGDSPSQILPSSVREAPGPNQKCEYCNGTGIIPDDIPVTYGPQADTRLCPACNGDGRITEDRVAERAQFIAMQQDRWLGVGKQALPRPTFTHEDVKLLREHAAALDRASAIWAAQEAKTGKYTSNEAAAYQELADQIEELAIEDAMPHVKNIDVGLSDRETYAQHRRECATCAIGGAVTCPKGSKLLNQAYRELRDEG